MDDKKTLSNEELLALVLKQGEQIETLTGLLTQGTFIKDAVKRDKPKLPAGPAKYKGKEYQALVPAFKLKGVSYTAEQAVADDKLLAEVLAIKGQQIFKELV